MTRSKLLLSTSLCMALALPAYAQSRSFSQVDSNGDGQLDRSELASVFGTRNANRILSRSDGNGDGVLSVQEVRISRDDDESDDDEDDDNENDDDGSGDSESDDSESDDSESSESESDGESDGDD